MTEPSTSRIWGILALGVVSGILLPACGGTPQPTPGGDCDSVCRLVAVKCGGTTGQVGAGAGGCQGACAIAAGGTAVLAPCTSGAVSCEAAQACFSGVLGDGGVVYPDLGGGGDGGKPGPDSGPPPLDGGCGGEEVVGSKQVVPNVLLLLDQSGSMGMEDFGPNSEVRMAVLKRVAGSVVNNASLVGKIRWGMTPFPEMADEAAAQACLFQCDPFDFAGFQRCAEDCDTMFGGCNSLGATPRVEPGDDTVDQVSAAISALTPQGGTPSAEALRAMGAYLPTVTSPDHPSYVLLGTDGEPTCSDDENGSQSIAAAQALADAGIKVFVVGISSSVAGSDILNQIAIAGGAPRDDNPRFYPAENEQQLGDAFNEITNAVASCTFRLDHPAPNAQAVQVFVGTTSVPRNNPNGFTYVFENGGASISLNGNACVQFQSGGKAASVQVRFGCIPQG